MTIGLELWFKKKFKSTHIAQQNLFSTLPSIFTFNFDKILGSFKTFWGPNGLFLGSR